MAEKGTGVSSSASCSRDQFSHLVVLLSLGVWLELIAVQHGFCSKGTGNWKGWGATFYKADDVEASHLMANQILLVRT